MESELPDPLLGQVLGGAYRVTRRIGHGGMGAVYEASHVRLPKKFAIKFLRTALPKDKDAFARFRREAEVASSIGHRHIAEVFDFNYLADGSPYMVIEYLEGEDLATRLQRRRRLLPHEALHLCGQVASALSAAHKRGIVHRDLKPENIFLVGSEEGDDFVKLLDFGISKIRNAQKTLTADMTMLGTPAYMSPEQARGDQKLIDARTDVYALGAVLYEALTGVPAFGGETVFVILMKIANEMPPPLYELEPDLPVEADAVLRKALAKDPAQRYASASELWRALRRAFDLSDVSSQPDVRVPSMLTPKPRAASMPGTAARATAAYRTPDPMDARTLPAPPAIAAAPAPEDERTRVSTPPTFPRVSRDKPSTLSGAAAESVLLAALGDPWSRRKARLAGAAAGIVLVLGLWLGLQRAPAPGGLVPAPAKPATVLSPAQVPPPPRDPVQGVAPDPSPTAPVELAAKPDTVRIRFAVTPRRATIVLEGAPLTETRITRPRSSQPERVVVSADGYQSKQLEVVPNRDRTVRVELVASGRERLHKPSAGAKKRPSSLIRGNEL